MVTRVVFTVLFLSILVSACDESGSQPPATGALGVARWEVEVLARIGSLNDPEQVLTRVSQVVIGPENRIYIPQPTDRTIGVYDSHGAFLTTIGRAGEGPGEFSRLGQIGFVGDTLVALDSGASRLNRFLPDGTYLDTRRWRPELVQGTSGVVFAPGVPQEFVPSVQGASIVKPGMTILPSAQTGTLRIPFFRVDSLAQVTDTLAWEEMFASTVRLKRAGREFRIETPFSDAPLYGLMPDGSGLVVVQRSITQTAGSPSFQLLFIDPSGDTLSSRVFKYSPILMTDDVVQRIVGGARVSPADRPDGPTGDEIEQTLRSEGLIPTTLAPVTGIALGQDGTVWVRREEVMGDSVSWDIISNGDGGIGRVSLPRGETVMAAREGIFVTRELDDLDVPYLQVYRFLLREP